MAESIKIRLDESRYIPPTQDDIREAKQYVLRREDNARQLRDSVDEVLSNLAEDIVTCCYKYNVDPYTFTISSSYNEDMMAEISDFMDDAELEILDLIYDYSTKATKDNDHIAALIAWLATLGRGNRNLQDTLDGYLYKTMKDFEAAIAAMRFMGVKLSDAVTKLKTYMHSVYTMPEVLTAFRRRQNFNAAYIRLGGVQPGAVGLSNNGSTNVTNMATITSQMAWMREQGVQMRESGASGYYQLRGSTFNCDLCDDEVGFHPNLDEIETAPYPHPHCKCYRVPIYKAEEIISEKRNRNYNSIITDNFKERRRQIKEIAKSLRLTEFTNKDVDWRATISGAGINEWINQPHAHLAEKNEALLNLSTLFANSTYMGKVKDSKNRPDVLYSHIFRTKIANDMSWIIVHEMRWGTYLIHSIADNNPIK